MLLFDRCRLGIALRDDDATELRAQFTGYLLPCRFAIVVAEPNPAISNRVGKKDAPAVIGHLDVAVAGPALRVDANRSAQVDVVRTEIAWSLLLPPGQKPRLPVLERPLQLAVVGKVDIIRNLFTVIDTHGYSLTRIETSAVRSSAA